MFFFYEIANKIEELRLKFAVILEKFLWRNLLKLGKLFLDFFISKKYVIIPAFIVVLSIYLRSIKDLYFVDSGEVIISNFWRFISVDIIGVFGIYLFKRNFSRLEFLAKNLVLLHSLIIAIAVAYFLRPIFLYFNNFAIFDSLFLFSYFFLLSILFVKEKSRSDYLLGTLSAIFVVFYLCYFFDISYLQNNLFEVVKFYFYPVILFILIIYPKISHQDFLSKLAKITVLSVLVMCFVGDDLVSKALIYAIFLPFLAVFMVYLIQKFYFNFVRNWFLLLVLVIFQFQSQLFFEVLVNANLLWWVFVIFAVLFSCLKDRDISYLGQIFYPKSLLGILLFGICVILSNYFILSNEYFFVSWFISLAFLLFYVVKFIPKFVINEFSLLVQTILVIILAFVLSLISNSIFLTKDFIGNDLKSPNYVSDQLLKNIKNSNYDNVYFEVSSKHNYQSALNYVDIAQVNNIKDANIIIIEKSVINEKACLENFDYFDQYFLNNFEFFNRIVEIREEILDKNIYFEGIYADEEIRKLQKIVNDYEIYVRKIK